MSPGWARLGDDAAVSKARYGEALEGAEDWLKLAASEVTRYQTSEFILDVVYQGGRTVAIRYSSEKNLMSSTQINAILNAEGGPKWIPFTPQEPYRTTTRKTGRSYMMAKSGKVAMYSPSACTEILVFEQPTFVKVYGKSQESKTGEKKAGS